MINDKDTPAFKVYKKDFLTGGKGSGYNDEQLQTILHFLYEGINKCTIKANTANHTLITYQMAYLKAHYEKHGYRGPA
jgi:DNA polymerase III alpha subunit